MGSNQNGKLFIFLLIIDFGSFRSGVSSVTRQKVRSVRRGGRVLQLLEPPDPTNSSYQQIQRMEERIQHIENLAKRSLIG